MGVGLPPTGRRDRRPTPCRSQVAEGTASDRCLPSPTYGDDIRYAADQLGHEDPRFTLRVYAQATKRRDRLAKPQRDAFDEAIE